MHKHITMPKKLVELVEERVRVLGSGASFSGFTQDACRRKLKEDDVLNSIYNKLDKYFNSFPRINFKDFLKEVKDEIN